MNAPASVKEPIGAPHHPSAIVALAQQVAAAFRESATAIDEEGVFPQESLRELKRTGLMGLMVPREFGGLGVSFQTLSEVAQILAGGCLSTGMIWAMHCQQVAVLVDQAPSSWRSSVLSSVATEGTFIASVTSERGKGGHLLSAIAPLTWDGESVMISRDAPVVTGGAHADAYLITMRRNADSPPSDVALTYADSDQLEVTVQSKWDAMGMRGTHSVGLSLKGRVPCEQVIYGDGTFRNLAIKTMIPAGHIVWSSCWLGAAHAVLREIVNLLRDPKARSQYDITSDLFCANLAQVRLEIDMVQAHLSTTIRQYEDLRRDATAGDESFNDPRFQIQINNLKIIASEMLFTRREPTGAVGRP